MFTKQSKKNGDRQTSTFTSLKALKFVELSSEKIPQTAKAYYAHSANAVA